MATTLNRVHDSNQMTNFPFNEKKFYTILLDKTEPPTKHALPFYKSLITTFTDLQQEETGYILKEAPFISYLSILQNMLLAVTLAQPKLRSPELVILDALEDHNISAKLANQKMHILSSQQMKEVQLITNLCSKKTTLLIDDWLKDESSDQQKYWMLIFKSLVKKEQISIIFITSDPQLAKMGDIQLHSHDFNA